MSAPNFKELISDIKTQPDWRVLANRCDDYYDHEQLTPDQKAELKRLEKPDIIENLIHAPIDTVLGHEIQKRRDWMVKADDDDSTEVAEGLNVKLNETMRLCEANELCSRAYSSQVKTGVGWLHVRRNPYAMEKPYLIEFIHRDFIYWDMRSIQQDRSDCKWMARQQFLDKDDAKAMFDKKHHQLIDMVANSYSNMSDWEWAEGTDTNPIGSYYTEWQSNNANIEFIIDSNRKRVAIYEVYYREIVSNKPLIYWNDGRIEVFKRDNGMHRMGVISEMATVKMGTFRRMRQRYFIGPHKVIDRVSPYSHNDFPYISFFGYVEGRRNYPYGLIRGMIDSQDGYTNAIIEIHDILKKKQIFVNIDNLIDKMAVSDVVDELQRRDTVIPITGNKKVSDVVTVNREWEELYRLLEIMDRHKNMVRETAGIYDSFSGKAAASQSGTAIDSLAQLGATTLSVINSNYEYGRKKLGEHVSALLVEDWGDNPVRVMITEDTGQSRKEIILNEPVEGGTNNSIYLAKTQVLVADVQTSSGYRQQNFNLIMQMYESTKDPVQQLEIWPMLVESSDWPKRAEYLKKWHEKNGDSGTEEEQQAQKEQMMQQQAQEQEMVMAERKAELEYKQSQSLKNKSDAGYKEAETAKTIAEVKGIRQEQEMLESNAKDAMIASARRAQAERELMEVA